MSQKDNISEVVVATVLDKLGQQTRRLPRKEDAQTADFLAWDEGHRYLAEVRGRGPGEKYEAFLEDLSRGGVATLERRMSRAKFLDKVLKEKQRQLNATDEAVDFRTVWITGLHEDDQFLMESIWRTLYGIADILVHTPPTGSPETWIPPQDRTCLYYDYFSFYRCRDLDGVVFLSANKMCMFVNPLGPRPNEFIQSGLCAAFAKYDRLFDAETFSRSAEVVTLAIETDRRTPESLWQALRDQHGLLTTHSEDTVFQQGLLVPASHVAALREVRPRGETARWSWCHSGSLRC